MTPSANFALQAMHVAFLRSASLVVPSPQRSDWYQEWTGELCHVRRECHPAGAFSWAAAWELTAFCLGSFQDAVCLRRLHWETAVVSASAHGSARRCVLGLCAVLAMCAFVARILPGIQIEADASRNPLRPGLLLVQGPQDQGRVGPSISYAQYQDWNSRRQRFFSDLAFYRTERLPVEHAAIGHRDWRVAHASENLFQVLGVELALQRTDADADATVPQAILSQSRWRRDFNSNPAVIGEVFSLDHRHVRIVGIAPDEGWRLPSHPDLWIRETRAVMGEARRKSGYVLAQLSPYGLETTRGGDAVLISTVDADGYEAELRGYGFSAPVGSGAIYSFALFLAVLALPAVTSVFNSESNFASHRPSFRSRVKACAFLAAKFAAVAAIGYFGALDLAYCGFIAYSPTAEFLQFAASFILCLLGFRWVLLDQSRRCPVCLRSVSHPAQVGFASCNFLGWNGTEMICMGGHALLHVPSMPTSWFSRQRWVFLDASWDFLFADTVGPY